MDSFSINTQARLSGESLPFAGKRRSGFKSLLSHCSNGLPEEWIVSLEAIRRTVPDHRWQIFEMYLIENQSSRQVAERFNTTHFNVRVIAHRIRKRVVEFHEGLNGPRTIEAVPGNGGSRTPTLAVHGAR